MGTEYAHTLRNLSDRPQRPHVDVPGFDQSAAPSESCRVLPAAAQQMWQLASKSADMHNDKDRSQAWHGKCLNNAPERVKATS
jgi:hypothetical protein